MSAPIVTLSRDQLGDLAHLIAAELRATADSAGPAESPRGTGPPEFVKTKELAAILRCSPDLVRRRARELGGERIGSGPPARWRFDLDRALARWTAPPPEPTPTPAPPRRHRGRPDTSAVPLLPYRGQPTHERERTPA